MSGFNTLEWTVPTTVSEDTNNGFPRVALTSVDNGIMATLLWMQFDGTNTVINASTATVFNTLPPTNVESHKPRLVLVY